MCYVDIKNWHVSKSQTSDLKKTQKLTSTTLITLNLFPSCGTLEMCTRVTFSTTGGKSLHGSRDEKTSLARTKSQAPREKSVALQVTPAARAACLVDDFWVVGCSLWWEPSGRKGTPTAGSGTDRNCVLSRRNGTELSFNPETQLCFSAVHSQPTIIRKAQAGIWWAKKIN